MTELRVGLVQFDPLWENPIANRSFLEEQLSGWEGKADVWVLPEMFTTGFSMSASQWSETMEGPTHRWMKLMSQRLNAAFVGTWMVREGGHYWNRLFWVEPSGKTYTYNKVHLFRPAGESEIFQAGKERLVVSCRGFRICPLICYDLRFGYLSWQDSEEPIDLYLYLASWPASRTLAWRTLLQARAIENQAYVVGVNRIGADPSGLEHQGNSSVFDGEGNGLFLAEESEIVDVISLNKASLDAFRSQWPFWRDQKKDNFFGGKFGN